MKLESEIQKLSNTVFALKTTDIRVYPENYGDLSMNAALRAERIACQMRNLVCLAAPKKRSDYLQEAADAQGIEICQDEDLISITLPGLLPKRKQHVNAAFLHEPLNYALQNYLAVHSLPLYRECVVCFSQVYEQDGPFDRMLTGMQLSSMSWEYPHSPNGCRNGKTRLKAYRKFHDFREFFSDMGKTDAKGRISLLFERHKTACFYPSSDLHR